MPLRKTDQELQSSFSVPIGAVDSRQLRRCHLRYPTSQHLIIEANDFIFIICPAFTIGITILLDDGKSSNNNAEVFIINSMKRKLPSCVVA